MTDPVYLATSTTSLTVGTGPQKFVTQTGLAYVTGDRVRATSAGTGEWMEGLVSAYSADSLAMTSDLTNGTGTHADWEIELLSVAKDKSKPKDTGPVAFVEPLETFVGKVPVLAYATPIPRKGALTVAVVTTKGDPMGNQWNAVSLAGDDWAVMDEVEVHSSPDSTLPVLVFSNDDHPTVIGAGKGVTFRKVSPSLWLIS